MRETAYDPPKKVRRSGVIRKGVRRAKVAELRIQGKSQRQIAEILDVGKTTIGRDCQWLDSSERQARGQDTAVAILEELPPVPFEVPTNVEEYREREREAVIELMASRKTYRQVADALHISIATVSRHVTDYLQEYGDWGGRTMAEWRNEELIQVEIQMVSLQEDLHKQPIPDGVDDDGHTRYSLSEYQAGIIRKGARKQFAELLRMKAQLLSLLVQRQEIEVRETKYVVKMKGVDFSKLGPQDDAPMKGIIIEQQ